MSFFTDEQRYQILCSIKQGKFRPEYPTKITEDEQHFIAAYATKKVYELMADPECVKVLEQKFAHRFN